MHMCKKQDPLYLVGNPVKLGHLRKKGVIVLDADETA